MLHFPNSLCIAAFARKRSFRVKEDPDAWDGGIGYMQPFGEPRSSTAALKRFDEALAQWGLGLDTDDICDPLRMEQDAKNSVIRLRL